MIDLLHTSSHTMTSSQSFEIHDNESIIIDTLTLTLHAGGHRILTTGDRNLAELVLQVPNMPPEKIHLSGDGDGNVQQVVAYNEYSLAIEKIDWNGLVITLTVTRK